MILQILTFVAAVLLWKAYLYYRGLKDVEYTAGMRVLFAPMSLLGAILPVTSWNPSVRWTWDWRKFAYMNRTHEIISIVPMLVGKPSFYVGSLDVMKQIMEAERHQRTEKPTELSSSLLLWGNNLVAANGEAWKRHRRIMSPAFTQNTYRLVVQASVEMYNDMIATEGWKDKDEFVLDNIHDTTLKFAFTIIGRCGFGLPIAWKDLVKSGTMTISTALSIVSDTSIIRLVIPSWAYNLPIRSLKEMDESWRFVASFMDRLVAQKEAEVSSSVYDSSVQKGDVFTRLVEAYATNEKLSLNKDELIGNTFALLFAGHETTSQALAGTLAYLAIYQDMQTQAVAEIADVLRDGREIRLEDIPNMKYLFACFYETLRMFPAGVLLPRKMLADHPVRITRPDEKTFPLRKDVHVIVDMVGVHHDPELFPDPEKYQPTRWHDSSRYDVTMFGLGPRVCIGRKFAESEAICFLALFLRDWKVDVILENGESRQEYEERVMSKVCKPSLAFGVGQVKLKVIKRS